MVNFRDFADVVITINRHKLKWKFSRGFDSRKFAKIKPPRKFQLVQYTVHVLQTVHAHCVDARFRT